MQYNPVLFTAVTFLHDFFTTIWIGGLFTLGFTVFPSIKKTMGMGPETAKLIDAIQNRLSKLVYISIIGLFITGAVKGKMIPEFLGLFNFGNNYSTILAIKHILYGVMIVLAILRSRVAGRKDKGKNPKTMKIKALMLLANIILGIIVLFLSGLNAAIV